MNYTDQTRFKASNEQIKDNSRKAHCEAGKKKSWAEQTNKTTVCTTVEGKKQIINRSIEHVGIEANVCVSSIHWPVGCTLLDVWWTEARCKVNSFF